jgi:hypothetical protein
VLSHERSSFRYQLAVLMKRGRFSPKQVKFICGVSKFFYEVGKKEKQRGGEQLLFAG